MYMKRLLTDSVEEAKRILATRFDTDKDKAAATPAPSTTNERERLDTSILYSANFTQIMRYPSQPLKSRFK